MYHIKIQNKKVMWKYITRGNNGKDEICAAHGGSFEATWCPANCTEYNNTGKSQFKGTRLLFKVCGILGKSLILQCSVFSSVNGKNNDSLTISIIYKVLTCQEKYI